MPRGEVKDVNKDMAPDEAGAIVAKYMRTHTRTHFLLVICTTEGGHLAENILVIKGQQKCCVSTDEVHASKCIIF